MASNALGLKPTATVLQRRCLACDRPVRIDRDLHDDRYGYPGQFHLLVCDGCNHRTLDAQMNPAEISDLYTQYYPRSQFDMNDWAPPPEAGALRGWWQGLRASAFRWVPREVRVLDIGCGVGESLGYHRARGCDAHGVEADRNVARVAAYFGLDVKVGLFEPSDWEAASFDVVTMDQVIEHVARPADILNGIHRVLKPGGTLVVATPNANGWGARLFRSRWIHWHAPYHVQFFTPASMARLASQTGFRVERRAVVTNPAWLDFQWGHLSTYPRQGERSPYWTPGMARTLRQRVALKLLSVVDRLGLNVMFTRLMDAMQVGDNAVYVLRKDAG